jgi:hypothetical protein
MASIQERLEQHYDLPKGERSPGESLYEIYRKERTKEFGVQQTHFFPAWDDMWPAEQKLWERVASLYGDTF